MGFLDTIKENAETAFNNMLTSFSQMSPAYGDNRRKFIDPLNYLYTNTFTSAGADGEYDDPTVLTFKLEFGGWGASVVDPGTFAAQNRLTVHQETYDSLPQGLLDPNYAVSGDALGHFNDNKYYNAVNYLYSRNEDTRAEYLKAFVKGLYEVQRQTPWVFTQISGLDTLQEFSPSRGSRLDPKGAKISVSCQESVMLKIKTLFILYRKAAWDDEFQRWVLPDIYRKFKCIIYISENRRFHIGSGKLGGFSDMETTTDTMPIYAFECDQCEFDINSVFESEYSSAPEDFTTTTFSFTVGNVRLYGKNPLMDKLSMLFLDDLCYSFSRMKPETTQTNWRLAWMKRSNFTGDNGNPTNTHSYSDDVNRMAPTLQSATIIPDYQYYGLNAANLVYDQIVNFWKKLAAKIGLIELYDETAAVKKIAEQQKIEMRRDRGYYGYEDDKSYNSLIDTARLLRGNMDKYKKDMAEYIKKLQDKLATNRDLYLNILEQSRMDRSWATYLDGAPNMDMAKPDLTEHKNDIEMQPIMFGDYKPDMEFVENTQGEEQREMEFAPLERQDYDPNMDMTKLDITDYDPDMEFVKPNEPGDKAGMDMQVLEGKDYDPDMEFVNLDFEEIDFKMDMVVPDMSAEIKPMLLTPLDQKAHIKPMEFAKMDIEEHKNDMELVSNFSETPELPEIEMVKNDNTSNYEPSNAEMAKLNTAVTSNPSMEMTKLDVDKSNPYISSNIVKPDYIDLNATVEMDMISYDASSEHLSSPEMISMKTDEKHISKLQEVHLAETGELPEVDMISNVNDDVKTSDMNFVSYTGDTKKNDSVDMIQLSVDEVEKSSMDMVQMDIDDSSSESMDMVQLSVDEVEKSSMDMVQMDTSAEKKESMGMTKLEIDESKAESIDMVELSVETAEKSEMDMVSMNVDITKKEQMGMTNNVHDEVHKSTMDMTTVHVENNEEKPTIKTVKIDEPNLPELDKNSLQQVNQDILYVKPSIQKVEIADTDIEHTQSMQHVEQNAESQVQMDMTDNVHNIDIKSEMKMQELESSKAKVEQMQKMQQVISDSEKLNKLAEVKLAEPEKMSYMEMIKLLEDTQIANMELTKLIDEAKSTSMDMQKLEGDEDYSIATDFGGQIKSDLRKMQTIDGGEVISMATGKGQLFNKDEMIKEDNRPKSKIIDNGLVPGNMRSNEKPLKANQQNIKNDEKSEKRRRMNML